jgi:plastocyanin
MTLLALTLLLSAAPKHDAGVPWLAETMPLPLAVRTPEDLAFKAAAERQYLLFNLLAGGKLAWDRGDYETAATRWESLLRTPNLPQDLDAMVRPMAKEARARAGGQASSAPLPVEPPVTMTPTEPEAPAKATPSSFTVGGVVTGGGSHGPGGAVVVLRRTDGATPKPRATRVKAILQKGKRFIPHVLAIPVGATVEFRNEDDLFHNVFSLSKPNDFDLGLYKSGAQRDQVFTTPGPVQLLCNIHASMNGWLYVSDSPWFGQADGNGRFTVKNVPAGTYELEVWHEWSTQVVKLPVKVSSSLGELAVAVDGEKRAPAFVPDKAGKKRQPQLGY